MAEVERKRTSPVAPFLLGALAVIAILAAWFLWPDRAETPTTADGPPVTVEAPKLPDINMPDAPKLPRG